MSRTSTSNDLTGSKWIKRSIRLKIYARDNYTCFYCRCPVHTEYVGERPTLASLDHFNGRHGDNRIKNLVTSCVSCNGRKQDTDGDTFLSRVTRDEGPYPSLWEV